MEKKLIRKQITGFHDQEVLVGSIEEVISELATKKEEYEKLGWKDLHLEHFTDYDYSEIQLWGYRIETDAELAYRKKQDEKKLERAAKRLEKKKKELEEQEKEVNKLKNEIG